MAQPLTQSPFDEGHVFVRIEAIKLQILFDNLMGEPDAEEKGQIDGDNEEEFDEEKDPYGTLDAGNLVSLQSQAENRLKYDGADGAIEGDFVSQGIHLALCDEGLQRL